MSKRINISGQQFGRLVVIRPALDYGRITRWECRCKCGTVKTIGTNDLRSGRTRSCGCLHKERVRRAATKHGYSRTQIYGAWTQMIQRCTNPKSVDFKYYGGRGITVCKRWKNFASFLEDMGERSAGMTLERNNNNLGYFKNNCRWATRKEQTTNMRRHYIPRFRGSKNGNSKLSEADILPIRARINSGEACAVIANDLHVHETTIYQIKRKATWSHV